MPDYMYMLESRLSAEQRAAKIRVQELAAESGSNVYLTGGAVRDLISGMPIRDLDFTVEGNPFRLARELEKGGAHIVTADEKRREIEMIFSGDADGSLSAARDDVYVRPGTQPEFRWCSIMEDLHRRDFSLNAIAISLNPASRGLLLDPTNGLADLENREVRALSIHSFTNQPVRLLRALRYAARMDFRLEARTAEWFALALERGIEQSMAPGEIGRELRQLAREEKPAPILKSWESRGLIGQIHPQLAHRHPDYEMLTHILRARGDLRGSGLRPRLARPVIHAVLGRLKPRERTATLHRLEFRGAEIDAVSRLEDESLKLVKMLAGRKTTSPGEAFTLLEKTPSEVIAFVMAESSNSKVLGKIRNYLQKWRPLRQSLSAVVLDLENLGMEHGPKFDKVIENLFQAQLLGKGRSPEDRLKLLRKLSGIKEPPKKLKEEKKKPGERLKKRLDTREESSAGGAPASTAALTKTAVKVAEVAKTGAQRTSESPVRVPNSVHKVSARKGAAKHGGKPAAHPAAGKASRRNKKPVRRKKA